MGRRVLSRNFFTERTNLSFETVHGSVPGDPRVQAALKRVVAGVFPFVHQHSPRKLIGLILKAVHVGQRLGPEVTAPAVVQQVMDLVKESETLPERRKKAIDVNPTAFQLPACKCKTPYFWTHGDSLDLSLKPCAFFKQNERVKFVKTLPSHGLSAYRRLDIFRRNGKIKFLVSVWHPFSHV